VVEATTASEPHRSGATSSGTAPSWPAPGPRDPRRQRTTVKPSVQWCRLAPLCAQTARWMPMRKTPGEWRAQPGASYDCIQYRYQNLRLGHGRGNICLPS